MSYASVQTKRVGIEVLRNTGLNEVNKRLKEQELFKITKNNNGEIESIDFDTTTFNDALLIVSKVIRKKLSEVEKGVGLPEELYNNLADKKLKNGIIYEVPLGVMFNNAFLANLGPKVPVKITYSGNIGLDIKTRVSEYGVNSALIEIFVLVEVTQRSIVPFSSKDVKLTSEIPLVMKVIKGSVPNYLLGNNNTYSMHPLN